MMIKLIFGYWPSGKATASGAVIHWFESSIPSHGDITFMWCLFYYCFKRCLFGELMGSNMLTAQQVVPTQKDLPQIKRLYQAAFPCGEPFGFLLMMAKRRELQMHAFYEENVFVGLIYLILDHDKVYVLYLAVNPELRSKGLGSQMLAWLSAAFPTRKLFLDLEVLDDAADNAEQRSRRRAFYLKNNFQSADLFFEEEGIDYEVLTTGETITADEYQATMDVFTQGTFTVNFISNPRK